MEHSLLLNLLLHPNILVVPMEHFRIAQFIVSHEHSLIVPMEHSFNS